MKRTADVYRECAERGLSKSETARELGVSPQAVDDMAVRHNIIFRDGRDKGLSGPKSLIPQKPTLPRTGLPHTARLKPVSTLSAALGSGGTASASPARITPLTWPA